ncbi:MAG: hypothetical protein WC791_03380 [Candidatus Paceibacterota bacterium]|jgi:hypothetical protein
MNFKNFVDFLISSLITPLFGLFLAAAVVFFLWNIMGVIQKNEKPEELAKMKEKAIWGAIAITVMVSMWGLVNFFSDTFQLNNNQIQLDQFDRL